MRSGSFAARPDQNPDPKPPLIATSDEGIIWQPDPEDNQLAPFVRHEDGDLVRAAWAPQPGSQVAGMTCPLFEVLLEGTRGGGKTDLLLMMFGQHVGVGFGKDWVGMIFRQTYPELEDIMRKANAWFPKIWPNNAKFNKQTKTWTWKTGEELAFRWGWNEDHYNHYHGHNVPFLGFEELTTFASPDFYLSMMSVCRSTRTDMPTMVRATTNPYGCVPYGEVLTANRGWVPIQQVTTLDEVVSVDSLGNATIAAVSETHKYEFVGQMIYREGRGLSMAFTSEHRFAHLNTARTHHDMRRFDELPGQAVLRRTCVASSWVGDDPALLHGWDAGDFMELLGWFLTEGCLVRRDKSRNEIQIAQLKLPERARIRQLLLRMGLRFREDQKSFTVSDAKLRALLADQGYSYEKFVPRQYLGLSSYLLDRLLRALLLGDGSGIVYYTISAQLAMDVAEIGTKLGFAVYESSRLRSNRVRRCYQVSLSSRDTTQLNTDQHIYDVSTWSSSVNVERRYYQGPVYCLTVPGTETFFVRQNGCVWLSGNSGHSWVKRRFRLPIQNEETVGPIIDDAKNIEGEIEPTRVAIHSHLEENKVLLHADPHYMAKLTAAAGSNKAKLRAWKHGDWNVTAGGMIDDLWNPFYHVLPPFRVPACWTIDRAFDWGSTHPFSVGWWAESDGTDLTFLDGKRKRTVKGDLFLVREWYGSTGEPNQGLQLTARAISKGIVEREVEWLWRQSGTRRVDCVVRDGVADNQIFGRENAMCIADDMEEHVRLDNGEVYRGVDWYPADKSPGSIALGWEAIRQALQNALPNENGTPREQPGLYVVSTCTNWLEHVPSMSRSKKDPGKHDENAEDHDSDMTRYRVREMRSTETSGRAVGAF